MPNLFQRRQGRIPFAGALLLPLLIQPAPSGALIPMQEPQPTNRQVALTFDDLPVNTTRMDLENLQEITENLLAILKRRRIPFIGFVNEGKLYIDGQLKPLRVQLLQDWIEAGAELGNHSYSHPDLYTTPLADFEADVIQGEKVSRRLLQEAGKSLRYFRHPFLNTGPDLKTKEAFEDFLKEHGYQIAPVSIDNSEWIFARAYDNAFDQGDEALLQQIADAYIPYMESVFAYYEQQSRALLGYELKQILLLHSNRLNSDCLDGLLDMLSQREYRFISLEEALTDPAYQRKDGYAGRSGMTWLHRWALTEGKRGKFFAGEPETPAFVAEASQLGR